MHPSYFYTVHATRREHNESTNSRTGTEQGDRYARRSVHAATRHRESLKLPTTRAASSLHRPPFFLLCRATPIGSRARLICRGSVRSTEAGFLFQLARITRCRGDGLPRACGGMRTGMGTDDVWLTPGPLVCSHPVEEVVLPYLWHW